MAQIISLPWQDPVCEFLHRAALEPLGKTYLVAGSLEAAVDELRRNPQEAELVVVDHSWEQAYRAAACALATTNVATVRTLVVGGRGVSLHHSTNDHIIGTIPVESQYTSHLPDICRAFFDLGEALGGKKKISSETFTPVLEEILGRAGVPQDEAIFNYCTQQGLTPAVT